MRSTPIPNWVPPSVQNYVSRMQGLLPPPLFANDRAIMERLVTEPTMRHVWRHLKQHSKSDKALAEFFGCAWQSARFPNIVTTPKDRATLAAPWSSAAELCRWTNEHDIGARMNPDLAAALVRVADHFDDVARQRGRLDSPLVVSHHGKDDEARAYVRVLGTRTRELFGNTLYGTVATTASVALKRKIGWRQVRQWCNP